MPTPSEQKALAFIAIVALLGGAVRVVQANSAQESTPVQQQALARQAQAAESAASAQHARRTRGRKPTARDTMPHVVGGVASVPPTFARPDDPQSRRPFGFPAPSPRIDIGAQVSGPTIKDGPHTQARVDIDHATAAEIEKLPRIGPALARRIVTNRDSAGPFRTLEALHRVKGLGPATLKLLGPLVTFSGRKDR